MGINDLRVRYGISPDPVPVNPPVPGTVKEPAAGLNGREESTSDRIAPAESADAPEDRIETPSESVQEAGETSTENNDAGPGEFGEWQGGQGDDEKQSSGSGSFRSVLTRFVTYPAEFFRNPPEYWYVDAIFIILTIIGVSAIVLNLPAVLYFIFSILYSIIDFVLGIMVAVCAVIGVMIALVAHLGRRR